MVLEIHMVPVILMVLEVQMVQVLEIHMVLVILMVLEVQMVQKKPAMSKRPIEKLFL